MVTTQNRPFPMVNTITHPKKIQKKSRYHRVRQITPNWFKVTSADSGQVYDVNLGLNGGTCSCLWGENRPDEDHRSGCTHVIAALNRQVMRQGRQISVWSSEKDACRQHQPMIRIGDGVILTSRLIN